MFRLPPSTGHSKVGKGICVAKGGLGFRLGKGIWVTRGLLGFRVGKGSNWVVRGFEGG